MISTQLKEADKYERSQHIRVQSTSHDHTTNQTTTSLLQYYQNTQHTDAPQLTNGSAGSANGKEESTSVLKLRAGFSDLVSD